MTDGAAVTTRTLLLAGLATGLAALLWMTHCERQCGAALNESEALYDAGDPMAALRALDEVDARCDCSRFTEGDAPPELSLAIACAQRLSAADLDGLLSAAKGPILAGIRGTTPLPPAGPPPAP